MITVRFNPHKLFFDYSLVDREDLETYFIWTIESVFEDTDYEVECEVGETPNYQPVILGDYSSDEYIDILRLVEQAETNARNDFDEKDFVYMEEENV